MAGSAHDSPGNVIALVFTGMVMLVAGYVVGNMGGDGGDRALEIAHYDSSVMPLGEAPVEGPLDAELTIVAFIDPSDASSREALATVRQATNDRDIVGHVRFVYKFLPRNGNEALSAIGIAASRDGQFARYLEEIMHFDGDVDDEATGALANTLGLGSADDIAEALGGVLTADANLARQSTIRSAPGFVLNGQRLTGRQLEDSEGLVEAMRAELEAVQALRDEGVERSDLYAVRTSGSIRPQAINPRRDRAQADRGNRDRDNARQGGRINAERPERRRGGGGGNDDVERFALPLDGAYARGGEEALVTIVEFSDYECPFCSRAEGTVNQIIEEYGDQVRVSFRHNPLPMHPNAPLMSDAALAAGEQGHFWEMHERMFDLPRDQRNRAGVEAVAEELGLDMAQFRTFLDSERGEEQIEEDQDLASTFQARGTPHFFINGIRLRGAQPMDAFQEIIDAEIERAEALVAGGTPRGDVYDALTDGAAEEAAAPTPQQQPEQPETVDDPPPVGDAPTMGSDNPDLRVFVFSDFECPFCGRAGDIPEALVEEFGDRVQIVFKHFPLPFHQNATLAHVASMAAHEQGQFWEYHDILFDNQRALTRPDLESYAEQLGLDMARFRAALDNADEYQATIDSDIAEGREVGVRGTPSFVVGNRFMSGARPAQQFINTVREQLD